MTRKSKSPSSRSSSAPTARREENGHHNLILQPKELLEANTEKVYLKKNHASLDVSLATEKMKEGGMESRLFVTVFSVVFALASPIVVLILNARHAVAESDGTRLVFCLLSIITILYPMYFSSRSRYEANSTLAQFFFMNSRRYLLPVYLGLATWSSVPNVWIEAGDDAWHFSPSRDVILAVMGYYLAYFFLERYRRSCRPRLASNVDLNYRKMRILVVADALPPKVDGVATFADNSIRILSEKGHHVEVVTSIAGPETMWGAKIHRLPGMTTPISPGHSITLPLPTMFAIFRRVKPDAVHFFEVSPLNLASFAYCHIADIPCTFSHHTRLDLYVNLVTPQFPLWLNALVLFFLERTFYPLNDGNLCVCEALHEKVKTRGTHNVRRWSSGAAAMFDKSNRSEEVRDYLTGHRPDLPLVVHVGRLAPEKNSEELPAVVEETCKLMGGNVRFAVVGEGILGDDIRKGLRERGVEDRVVFAGFQYGEKLARCYASCDVFFSPSTSEGFPLVFIEAMASGLSAVGPLAGGGSRRAQRRGPREDIPPARRRGRCQGDTRRRSGRGQDARRRLPPRPHIRLDARGGGARGASALRGEAARGETGVARGCRVVSLRGYGGGEGESNLLDGGLME